MEVRLGVAMEVPRGVSIEIPLGVAIEVRLGVALDARLGGGVCSGGLWVMAVVCWGEALVFVIELEGWAETSLCGGLEGVVGSICSGALVPVTRAEG